MSSTSSPSFTFHSEHTGVLSSDHMPCTSLHLCFCWVSFFHLFNTYIAQMLNYLILCELSINICPILQTGNSNTDKLSNFSSHIASNKWRSGDANLGSLALGFTFITTTYASFTQYPLMSLYFILKNIFLASSHGLWHLRSLTRGWTRSTAVRQLSPNRWTAREFPCVPLLALAQMPLSSCRALGFCSQNY